MGVPGLKTWMQGEIPRAWEAAGRAVPLEGADHVYVDLNGALHMALQRARPRTRQKMRRQVEIWLSRMIRASRPRRTLFLAIDGPGPLAKLLHQRASRQTEARRLARAASQGREDEVSRLELTVGTELMAEVDSWVSAWAQEQLQGQWGHLRIVVSGCTVPGEGETKIIEELAANTREDGGLSPSYSTAEGQRDTRAQGQGAGTAARLVCTQEQWAVRWPQTCTGAPLGPSGQRGCKIGRACPRCVYPETRCSKSRRLRPR